MRWAHVMILEAALYIMGLAMLLLGFVRYRIDARIARRDRSDRPAEMSFPLAFFGAISLMLGVVMSGMGGAPL